MFTGEERFGTVSDERPGTLFLTDWLERNSTVPEGPRDRHLPRTAAGIVDVGLGELEERPTELVEAYRSEGAPAGLLPGSDRRLTR